MGGVLVQGGWVVVYDLVAIDFALNVRARQAKSEVAQLQAKGRKRRAKKTPVLRPDGAERRSYAMERDAS